MLNCLNRASIRALNKYIKNRNKKIEIIIDSTLIERFGKNVENTKIRRKSKGFINGHMFINFIVRIDDHIIPLSSMPHYTKKYCRKNNLKYRTENQIVLEWIEAFKQHEWFKGHKMSNVTFILDAGYDVIKIQKAIRKMGAHFTMAIKKSRNVNGLSVCDYFRNHRYLPWETIRFLTDYGNKKKRRVYRIRIAKLLYLNGVGKLNVACSEQKRRNRPNSRKYIVSSNLLLTAREIISQYRRRWAIEKLHMTLKQNYGFGDCSSSCFQAVQTHVVMVILAYLLQHHLNESLPKCGTTIHEFQQYTLIKESAQVINLFDGKEHFKRALFEVTQRVVGL